MTSLSAQAVPRFASAIVWEVVYFKAVQLFTQKALREVHCVSTLCARSEREDPKNLLQTGPKNSVQIAQDTKTAAGPGEGSHPRGRQERSGIRSTMHRL